MKYIISSFFCQHLSNILSIINKTPVHNLCICFWTVREADKPSVKNGISASCFCFHNTLSAAKMPIFFPVPLAVPAILFYN